MLNDGARAPPPRPDSGVHTVAIDSRATYTGSWRSGMRHGEGTMSWSSGQRYEGEWQDDKMHGRGTQVFADGKRYEGEWWNNKRHGQGAFTFPSGDRYEGDWQAGDVHGEGTFTDARGWSFTGGFDKDRPTRGVLAEADGTVHIVTYSKDCERIWNGPSPANKDAISISVAVSGGQSL